MAELTLGTYELRARPLPAVCACCGAPVAVWKPKAFSWYPRWVLATILAGVLVYAILAMVLTKRARTMVPLCDEHRNHFLSRALLTWLGFAGIFVVALLCGAIAGHHTAVWLALPVYFVAWLVVAAIAGQTAIRPVEITDHYMRLTNVSDAFVNAHLALGPVPMPGQMPYGVPMPYMQPRA